MHDPTQPAFYCYSDGELRALAFGVQPCAEVFFREVLANVEAKPHAAKPTKPELGAISNAFGRQKAGLVTCHELCRALSAGKTVLPSAHAGARRKDTWLAQQLFCIDVDNDDAQSARGYEPLAYTDAVLRAFELDLPLLISYETFSSTDRMERYRLVFAADEPKTDPAEAEAYARALMGAFPETDQSSGELARLFCGTNKGVELWSYPLAA